MKRSQLLQLFHLPCLLPTLILALVCGFSTSAATLKRRAFMHTLAVIGLLGLAVHATPSVALDIGKGWTADTPVGVAYSDFMNMGTEEWGFTIMLSSAANTATTIHFTNDGSATSPPGSFFNLTFKGVNTGSISWTGVKIVIRDTTEDPIVDGENDEDYSNDMPHQSRAHIHRLSWDETKSLHFKCVGGNVDDFCGFEGRYDMTLGLKDGANPITQGNSTNGGILRLHDKDERLGQPNNKPMKFELTFTPTAAQTSQQTAAVLVAINTLLFLDDTLSNSNSLLVGSGDYNGDGRADLIWRSGTTGQVYGALLNGFSILQEGFFYQEPNQAWQIVNNGDFDGNQRSDLLWWNSSTGQVYLMPMNGLVRAGGEAIIYQETNTAWQIVAAGDLNGDDRADLIWWNNQTGQVYGMLMNGTVIGSQGMIYQEPNTAWRILTARDFTGDGKVDLLWRNTTTGQIYLMPMNGLVRASSEAMVYQEPNLAWQIVAVGDLNGDGRADLIWWNNQTGQVYGMLMNGAAIVQQGMIYQEPNTAWQIAATGDYNGDSKADLLWHNASTLQDYEMPMNGLSIIGGQLIYQESNLNWRIVADADAPRLPAKALAGNRYAPLTGELLNPHQPFDGKPVNPYQPMTGEPSPPLSKSTQTVP